MKPGISRACLRAGLALDEHAHRLFLVTASFGPTPPATAEQPHPRPAILPGTFRLLVVEPAKLSQ